MSSAPAPHSLARSPELERIAAALAAPFDPREVKFKPQIVKNNRALVMAYIDARLIQDRLDEVLGMENWQDRYDFLPDGSVVCHLRLRLGDRWVTKTDVGSPSEQPDSGDRVKAAVSDALKRAAVKFGIGRYLYRLPAQWCDYDPVKKQLLQTPRLPAFALPASKNKGQQQSQSLAKAASHSLAGAEPCPVARAGSQPTVEAAVKSPHAATEENQQAEATWRVDLVRVRDVEPTRGPADPAAGSSATAPGSAAGTPGLPVSGTELYRRLQRYDAKLAAEKLCDRGALLAHVLQVGVKAGYAANLADWAGPAITLAVKAVREFEQARRATNSADPKTAA